MQPIDYSHASGYWHDGWVGNNVEFTCTPPAGTKNIRVIFEKTPHIDNLLVLPGRPGAADRLPPPGRGRGGGSPSRLRLALVGHRP